MVLFATKLFFYLWKQFSTSLSLLYAQVRVELPFIRLMFKARTNGLLLCFSAQSAATQTMPISSQSSLPSCHAQLSFEDTVKAVYKALDTPHPTPPEAAFTRVRHHGLQRIIICDLLGNKFYRVHLVISKLFKLT